MRVRTSTKPMRYQGFPPVKGQELINRTEIREAQAALDADPQNEVLQAALREVRRKIAGRNALSTAITAVALKRTKEQADK